MVLFRRSRRPSIYEVLRENQCGAKPNAPGQAGPVARSTLSARSIGQNSFTKWAVSPLCEIDSRAFLSRGREAAAEVVLDKVRRGEWRWVAEIDIRGFYSAINQERLAGLIPVDRATYDAIIVSREAEREYPKPL